MQQLQPTRTLAGDRPICVVLLNFSCLVNTTNKRFFRQYTYRTAHELFGISRRDFDYLESGRALLAESDLKNAADRLGVPFEFAKSTYGLVIKARRATKPKDLADLEEEVNRLPGFSEQEVFADRHRLWIAPRPQKAERREVIGRLVRILPKNWRPSP